MCAPILPESHFPIFDKSTQTLNVSSTYLIEIDRQIQPVRVQLDGLLLFGPNSSLMCLADSQALEAWLKHCYGVALFMPARRRWWTTLMLQAWLCAIRHGQMWAGHLSLRLALTVCIAGATERAEEGAGGGRRGRRSPQGGCSPSRH